MKLLSTRTAVFWIHGTLIAFGGVLMTRLVAPHFMDPARAGVAVAGQLLGVAGLFIIALGVRGRLHGAAPDGNPAP